MPEPTWWDVFPKEIRQTQNVAGVHVPIVVRGNPPGELNLEIGDSNIASLGGDGLVLGERAGSTMVTVRAGDSARHIQVIVEPPVDLGYGF